MKRFKRGFWVMKRHDRMTNIAYQAIKKLEVMVDQCDDKNKREPIEKYAGLIMRRMNKWSINEITTGSKMFQMEFERVEGKLWAKLNGVPQ